MRKKYSVLNNSCLSGPGWLSWMHVRLVIRRLRFDSCWIQQYSFVEFDHVIFSTVISPFHWFKKGTGLFLVKACAQVLVNCLEGLGGSFGCAVRLETRRSLAQPPPRSATFFRGDWSWNIFYGHSLPSADSRRAVVSFWRKNVHNTG